MGAISRARWGITFPPCRRLSEFGFDLVSDLFLKLRPGTSSAHMRVGWVTSGGHPQRFGSSGQISSPFIHLIHPGDPEEIICPPEQCCGGRGPTELCRCWKVMFFSGRNKTQRIFLSLSRDSTVFLKTALSFLRKLAVFNKKTSNWSLFRQFGIYSSVLFSAKVRWEV